MKELAWQELPGKDVQLPLVSIVVTSYNYANYIEAALASVVAQTYSNVECIIVDDASSDNTCERVAAFIAKHGLHTRMRLLRHELNRGQMGGFKTGLAEAKGEFLVYLDADDVLLPNFITGHLAVHLEHYPVAFSTCNQYQINALGELIGGHHADLMIANEEITYLHTFQLNRHRWYWSTTSSMMFRKSVLEILFPQQEEEVHFRICADYYLAHFAHLLGGSALMPQRYSCYRRHGKNQFSVNPITGGYSPTGDMSKHPAHTTMRRVVKEKLLADAEVFVRRLGLRGWINALLKVCTLQEMLVLFGLRHVRRHSPNVTVAPAMCRLTVVRALFRAVAHSWKVVQSAFNPRVSKPPHLPLQAMRYQ